MIFGGGFGVEVSVVFNDAVFAVAKIRGMLAGEAEDASAVAVG